MHVSRGISAKRPLRWNCAPEVTRLVLTNGVEQAIQSDERIGLRERNQGHPVI